MKINSIIHNQVIRIFTVDLVGPEVDRVMAMRVLRTFEARYAFLQGPRVVSDYNPQTGIEFLQGNYGHAIIDKFKIFNNGLLSEAKISTDEIDAFLDDASTWARRELGLMPFSKTDERGRLYLSQVEVESEVDLSLAFSWLAEFGSRLSEQIKTYGVNTRDFEVTSIQMHCDIMDLEIPRPGVAFQLERREQKPYRPNTYFAVAPLRTLDHYRFLEEFEALLAAHL